MFIIYYRYTVIAISSILLFYLIPLIYSLPLFIYTIPLFFLLLFSKNPYINVFITLVLLVLNYFLPVSLGIFILFPLFLALLFDGKKLYLYLIIFAMIPLSIQNMYYLLFIFLIFIYLISNKNRKEWVLLYIWLFIFISSISAMSYLGIKNISILKLKQISNNEQVKNLILKGNTSFLSYIINEVYYSGNISKISLFDKGKILLDQSPSSLINNLPKINKTSKKNIISLNGVKYHYLYFFNPIKEKKKLLGFFRLQILNRDINRLDYFMRAFSLSGILFIFFTFFFLIYDNRYIKYNLVSRNNNIFLTLLLLLLAITVFLYLVLNNTYNISRRLNYASELQNSSVVFLTNIKKEISLLKNKLNASNNDYLSGDSIIENNIHIKFIKQLKIEKNNIPIMFNGNIYFASSYKRGTLLFLFKDLYANFNSAKDQFITVLLKDQIVYNSNIHGVILNEIDYNIGEIRYTHHFINFAVAIKGANRFIFIFSKQLNYLHLGLWFYFGIYFYLLIFLYFIIKFIITYFNRELLILENGFLQLRSGNYSYKIETNKNMAFEKLFNDFNLMVERLKIARKKELENEALKNLELISKKIAHEIKNPLTPITMLLSHLRSLFEDDKDSFDEEFLKSVDIIYEQLEYLKKISTEFYTLGKYSSFKREYFKLEEFMEEIKNIYQDIFQRIGIIFHAKFPSKVIYTDKNILRHIFINIIENAIDALKDKEEKWIDLKIYEDNEAIVIRFEDSGGGVKKELLSKLFDADFSTKKAGMGIGLSFIKKSIEIQKGNIKLKNGEKGLIIEIYLPAF